MEQGPKNPSGGSSIHLWPTQRCRLCQFEENEAIHRPVGGSGMFATLGAGDDDAPWETHWVEPHHPFVAPAPPTFTHLARSIADHALDLEADDQLSWETAGFDSLADELDGAYPDSSVEIEVPVQVARRRGIHRVAAWLTSMMVFLSFGAVAFASTNHQDIVTAQERIEALELERITLLARAVDLEAELADEIGSTARAQEEYQEAAAEWAKLEVKRVDVATAVYPAAVGGGGELGSVFGADAIDEATLAAAYAGAAATFQDGVAAEAASKVGELEDGVPTTGRTRALETSIRDLWVRIAEVSDTLAQAHLDYEETRAAAQRRIGVSDRVEQWRDLVAKHFPPEVVDDALVVMACESSGKPQARAWPKSTAVGLFQFLTGVWEWTLPRAGIEEGTPRTDPEANVKAAAWLWDFAERTNHPDGPWGPWSCRP